MSNYSSTICCNNIPFFTNVVFFLSIDDQLTICVGLFLTSSVDTIKDGLCLFFNTSQSVLVIATL